jgi:hypothetical protein
MQFKIYTSIGIDVFDLNRKIRTMKNLLLLAFLICFTQPASAQEDCKEGMHFEAANKGSVVSQTYVGLCFAIQGNHSEAAAWYRKAAE